MSYPEASFEFFKTFHTATQKDLQVLFLITSDGDLEIIHHVRVVNCRKWFHVHGSEVRAWMEGRVDSDKMEKLLMYWRRKQISKDAQLSSDQRSKKRDLTLGPGPTTQAKFEAQLKMMPSSYYVYTESLPNTGVGNGIPRMTEPMQTNQNTATGRNA